MSLATIGVTNGGGCDFCRRTISRETAGASPMRRCALWQPGGRSTRRDASPRSPPFATPIPTPIPTPAHEPDLRCFRSAYDPWTGGRAASRRFGQPNTVPMSTGRGTTPSSRTAHHLRGGERCHAAIRRINLSGMRSARDQAYAPASQFPVYTSYYDRNTRSFALIAAAPFPPCLRLARTLAPYPGDPHSTHKLEAHDYAAFTTIHDVPCRHTISFPQHDS